MILTLCRCSFRFPTVPTLSASCLFKDEGCFSGDYGVSDDAAGRSVVAAMELLLHRFKVAHLELPDARVLIDSMDRIERSFQHAPCAEERRALAMPCQRKMLAGGRLLRGLLCLHAQCYWASAASTVKGGWLAKTWTFPLPGSAWLHVCKCYVHWSHDT